MLLEPGVVHEETVVTANNKTDIRVDKYSRWGHSISKVIGWVPYKIHCRLQKTETRFTHTAGYAMSKSLTSMWRCAVFSTAWHQGFTGPAGEVYHKLLIRAEQVCKIPCFWGALESGLQLVKYDHGQKFSAHFDSSSTSTDKKRGRVTLLVYLNDDFQGGETNFETMKCKVWPKMCPPFGSTHIHCVSWKAIDADRRCFPEMASINTSMPPSTSEGENWVPITL